MLVINALIMSWGQTKNQVMLKYTQWKTMLIIVSNNVSLLEYYLILQIVLYHGCHKDVIAGSIGM